MEKGVNFAWQGSARFDSVGSDTARFGMIRHRKARIKRYLNAVRLGSVGFGSVQCGAVS